VSETEEESYAWAIRASRRLLGVLVNPLHLASPSARAEAYNTAKNEIVRDIFLQDDDVQAGQRFTQLLFVLCRAASLAARIAAVAKGSNPASVLEQVFNLDAMIRNLDSLEQAQLAELLDQLEK
jgi:hypothetical protein